MTPEESVTAYAEWTVERWFAYVGTTMTFTGFWDSIASQVTVAVLRDAARILKIDKPAKTRSALREQFAVAWTREPEPPGAL
jgi:hypothetical protein